MKTQTKTFAKDIREFLGWERPILESAADYLISRFVQSRRLDMRNVLVALPGRRAIKRLEEILIGKIELEIKAKKIDSAWYPPEFLTLGTILEQFYELKFPLADDLTQRLAWLRVIDRMEDDNPEFLAKLIPHPPHRADLEARLSLGRVMAKLHRELAADGLDFKRVAELCRQYHLDDEAARWDVLGKLQDQYLILLDSLHVWDLQTARLRAVQYKEPKTEKQIVLVELVDMNQAQKNILNFVWEHVTALVFAPDELKDSFDSFGCLIPEAWSAESIASDSVRKPFTVDLDDAQIHVVESPDQQVDTVIRLIAGLNGQHAAEEIVIGVPDNQVVPVLEQRLQEADLQSRHFEGTPMKRTAVFRFLQIALEFIKTRSFRSFAELVRHPNVDLFLKHKSDDETSIDVETADMLSALDNYYTQFLPQTVGDYWKPLIDERKPDRPDKTEPLRILWNRVKELFGEQVLATDSATRRLAIPEGLEIVDGMLSRLASANDSKSLSEPESRIFEAGIKRFKAAETTLFAIPAELLDEKTLPEVFMLVLGQLETANVPPHENKDAIELIGWLEIVPDDAPHIIVTGMNDGFVPSFLTSDIFLPDRIRRDLGIEDNQRRFARDAYALSVILGSRRSQKDHPQKDRSVHLVGGRRSAEGDPLLPSRLFFATDNKTLAKRVDRFFKDIKDIPKPAPLILTKTVRSGSESLFKVPEPMPIENFRSMRVTEFADYLRCPYRYYLKNRLRLQSLGDAEEELNAAAFGTMLHDVLEKFGKSKVRDSVDPESIFIYLDDLLTEFAAARYGECDSSNIPGPPRPVVAIQFEQARARLKAFAQWQAEWRKSGRVIRETEFSFDEKSNHGRIFLDVDGKPMFLRGRIDRIDLDTTTGELVVLDYKSADRAADPEKKHRKKNPEGELVWTDLQLPLYHYILRRAGYKENISLGYIALPKDVQATKECLATWDAADLKDAEETAKDIVRKIRQGFFPKTDPPPPFSEEFAAICLDQT